MYKNIKYSNQKIIHYYRNLNKIIIIMIIKVMKVEVEYQNKKVLEILLINNNKQIIEYIVVSIVVNWL